MSLLISSVQNPLIKQYSALHQKKERDTQQLILVETLHPIEEALKAGLVLRDYFYLETENHFPFNLPDNAASHPVSVSVMKKLSTTDSVPPCVAIFSKPATVTQTNWPFLLVLDGLQDPGNLGSLIRSAVAFGVDAIITTPGTVDSHSPKVIRASAGLVFRLPIITSEKPLHTLLEDPVLAPRQWLLTTSHQAIQPLHYKEAPYKQSLALVLGNEGTGLSESLLQQPGIQAITIPIAANTESLNVSVSGAIILAEIAHQRQCVSIQ